MGLRVLFCGLLLAVLIGCADDPGYRTQGPGLSLSAESIGENAQTQNAYFMELCQLAGIASLDANTCAATNFTEITLVGMNDIDLRCDRYLRWVDNVRIERLAVNRGAVSLGGFLGGVIGLAAPESEALAYIALALGFGTEVYDTYQNSILLGLESSTVHEIVYERRNAFRQSLAQEFRRNGVTKRSRAVFLLRNYLRICTPNSIVLDVNTFARGGAVGDGPSAESRTEDILGSRPPTPDDPAGGRQTNDPVNRHPDVTNELNFDDGDLRLLQRDMCISDQGGVGSETRTNLRMFEFDAYGAVRDGIVTRKTGERASIGRGSCTGGAKNVFEKRIGEAEVTVSSVLADIKNAELADVPEDVSGITLASPEFRTIITNARTALLADEAIGLATKEATVLGDDTERSQARLENQVTPMLIQAIQAKLDAADG